MTSHMCFNHFIVSDIMLYLAGLHTSDKNYMYYNTFVDVHVHNSFLMICPQEAVEPASITQLHVPL